LRSTGFRVLERALDRGTPRDVKLASDADDASFSDVADVDQ
jgi:hypothetical protein